ncbi:hydrolase [Arhodomonas sp. KWT2]|uniref:hydrolase n=2 Tax=unclassified Arhodomonas TaxID=2621637 RepID=UPI0035BFD3A9
MSDAIYTALREGIARRRDEALAMVETLAAINSGSTNTAGVHAVAEAVAAAFDGLGAEVVTETLPAWERVDDDGGHRSETLGPLVRLIREVPGAPSVLLVGHTDTVFPADSPFQSVWREGPRLRGPGVADMKGGLVVMREALHALESGPAAGRIGWEVILNPDEEIGSPVSAPVLEAAAARHRAGLVFEPSLPDGTLAGARRGSGNWTAVFAGRSAHAGREHHLGRNAVAAAARFITAIDGLNGQRPGVTVNPAFVRGGGASNVVPDRAVVRFNVRVTDDDDATWVTHQLDRAVASVHAPPDYTVALHGGFSRPPKPMSAGQQTLLDALRACAEVTGGTLDWAPTGGCCDGNNLAAAGLPNVDTLGVVGGGIHSDSEYMEIDSLVERAGLVGSLLVALATGDAAFPEGGDARDPAGP